MRHRVKFRQNRLHGFGDIAFSIFKMAADRHPGFVERILEGRAKSTCKFLSWCKIWLVRCSSFDNTKFECFAR